MTPEPLEEWGTISPEEAIRLSQEKRNEGIQRTLLIAEWVLTIGGSVEISATAEALHLAIRGHGFRSGGDFGWPVILFLVPWSVLFLFPFQRHERSRLSRSGPLSRVVPGWRPNVVVVGIAAVTAVLYGELVLRAILLSRTTSPTYLQLLPYGQRLPETLVANVGVVMLVFYAIVAVRLALHLIALRFNPVPTRDGPRG